MKRTIGVPSKRFSSHPTVDKVQAEALTELNQKLPIFIYLVIRVIPWLWDCGVSDEGCAALTSALRSNPSHLRDLDLSYNNLGDSGVKMLSALKDDEHYKLQTLNSNKYEIIRFRL
ncbi:hypothetical protein QTP70_019307 [Hemibagrus guttatus]|uniref:Uncharacterized protein n=1 Tax=Hemibagrus guttatus TaxID=175788 RepID=A0AAE0PPN7_9TELE|nr:hypothetical protein QTP70_019307 [Hemibagrus guttatus]